MWGCACLSHAPRDCISQPVRRVIRQSGIVTPLSHECAKRLRGSPFAVSGLQKCEVVPWQAVQHRRQIGHDPNVDPHPVAGHHFLPTIADPVARDVAPAQTHHIGPCSPCVQVSSDRQVRPCQRKPSSTTSTSLVRPSHSRISRAPGATVRKKSSHFQKRIPGGLLSSRHQRSRARKSLCLRRIWREAEVRCKFELALDTAECRHSLQTPVGSQSAGQLRFPSLVRRQSWCTII